MVDESLIVPTLRFVAWRRNQSGMYESSLDRYASLARRHIRDWPAVTFAEVVFFLHISSLFSYCRASPGIAKRAELCEPEKRMR